MRHDAASCLLSRAGLRPAPRLVAGPGLRGETLTALMVTVGLLVALLA